MSMETGIKILGFAPFVLLPFLIISIKWKRIGFAISSGSAMLHLWLIMLVRVAEHMLDEVYYIKAPDEYSLAGGGSSSAGLGVDPAYLLVYITGVMIVVGLLWELISFLVKRKKRSLSSPEENAAK